MSEPKPKLKKLADGKTEKGKKNVSRPSDQDTEQEKGGSQYIYISYSWKDQPTVLRIKDSLQKQDFNVWIDVDELSGLGSPGQMTNAVERAAVVMICFSSSYRYNNNCRSEAEYAYNRGKVIVPVCVEAGYHPVGWLGFLLGSKSYFHFDKEEFFEKNIKSLVGELRQAISHSSIELPQNSTTLSPEQIQLYYDSMRDGVGTYRHIRVVLVGYEGVGKTTLCKRIVGDKKDLDKVTCTDGANLYIQRFWIEEENGTWVRIDGDLTDQVVRRLRDVVVSYQSQSGTTSSPEGDVKLQSGEGEQDAEISVIYSRSDESESLRVKSPAVPSQWEITSVDELANAVIDGSEKDKPANTVYSSLWDFAGQKDYYCTHHCFLSADAVYLVVFNASHCQNEEECDRLLYWLRSLKTYSIPTKKEKLTPPVILVGTHEDKIQVGNPKNVFYEFVNTKLNERGELRNIDIFRSILLNSISDSEDKFHELRDMIIEAALHQDQWEKRLPAKWLALEREIMKKKAANTKMMTMKEIKELNSKLKSPIREEEELKMFLGYLHASRILIYFGESGILESQIIIDPQWLVDAFRCLIKSESFVDESRTHLFKEWKEFRRTAKLTKELCKLAWDKSDFERYSEELIAFMERFGLIASPLIDTDDDNGHDYHCDFFFVPSLFEEPDFNCLGALNDKDNVVMSKTLCFVVDQDFVPIEIYDRVMAGCISKLSMEQGSGKKIEKCIKRGFGLFKIDALWNLIVLCQRSVISLTLFNKAKKPCADSMIGTKTRHLIEGILKSTLERNRQGQLLSFDYAFHCGYKLDADDEPIFLNEALKYIDECPVPCCEDKEKPGHYLNNGDIQFWGFNIAVLKPNKSRRTKDDRLDSWMMGRISRHIPTDDNLMMFFINLGFDPDKDIKAKQVEFDRCSIFTQFAHILNVWKNRHGKASAQEILDKMEECSISTVDLQQELFVEKANSDKLDLPSAFLNCQLDNYDINRCLPYLTTREYQLVFMELDLPMETIAFQSSLTIEEHIKSLLREWRSTAGQRATVGLLLTAMKRNDLNWFDCAQSLKEWQSTAGQ